MDDAQFDEWQALSAQDLLCCLTDRPRQLLDARPTWRRMWEQAEQARRGDAYGGFSAMDVAF